MRALRGFVRRKGEVMVAQEGSVARVSERCKKGKVFSAVTRKKFSNQCRYILLSHNIFTLPFYYLILSLCCFQCRKENLILYWPKRRSSFLPLLSLKETVLCGFFFYLSCILNWGFSFVVKTCMVIEGFLDEALMEMNTVNHLLSYWILDSWVWVSALERSVRCRKRVLYPKEGGRQREGSDWELGMVQ